MEDENGPTIDLETFVSSYTGHIRILRLLFLAEKRQGTPLELDALRMAHDEVKQSENVALYGQIVDRIAGRMGPAYALDRQWVANQERASTAKQERVEADLATAKVQVIKENICMGHSDLGDIYYARGDLNNAFKSYGRMRDYNTSPKHIIRMCLSLVRVSLEMNNLLQVGNYISKAETTPDSQADPVVAAKVTAASGLHMLLNKRYKQAARKLLDVTADLGNNYSDVLAMQDVALYAALCALATFDRDEVQRRLVKNIAFKELLDTVPEIREVVHDFYGCRYARALASLTALVPTLSLDLFLDQHLASLVQQIRQRALVQYTSPFTTLKLATMAAAFNTTEAELRDSLSQLIADNHIAARIDAHAGVLHAKRTDPRAAVFAKVLAATQQYLAETKAALLRVDLHQHDFMQKPPRGAGGGGGGGGGGGPGGRMDMSSLLDRDHDSRHFDRRAGGGSSMGRMRGPGGSSARHIREMDRDRERHHAPVHMDADGDDEDSFPVRGGGGGGGGGGAGSSRHA